MVALIGVALGAFLTFVVQWVLSQRMERLRRRTELLEACAAFAGAAENARGSQYDRWWSGHERRDTNARALAKATSYQRRTQLRASQSRLRLLGVDEAVNSAADTVVTSISGLHKAASKDDIEQSGLDVLVQINKFLDLASRAL